jgi:hypothetical protein
MEAYEETIRDPSIDALQAASAESNGLKPEITSLDTQSFLSEQLTELDKIRQGAEPSGMDSSRQIRGRGASQDGDEGLADEARVNEHIGPVQFNMGGIQVDADDMLQRLRVSYYYFLILETLMLMKSGSPIPNSRTYIPRSNCFRWQQGTKRSLGIFLCRPCQESRRWQCSEQS